MTGASASDSWLTTRAAERERAGTRRVILPRSASEDGLLDLAGNDYLGLARDPRLIEAGVEALRTWGASSGASRLVTGTTTAHIDLEQALADFTGCAAGLVFSSGYLANLAAITALTDSDTLLLSDERSHASLVDACRLSRAEVRIVAHNDVAAVQAELTNRTHPRALVVTESVFSADGDAAPLAELGRACAAAAAVLLIDEAHGIGVTANDGRGGAAQAGLTGRADVVLTVTLSKALGGQGGAVLGSAAVREQLQQTARSFIFDTGLAPASVATAREALRILESEPGLVKEARAVAQQLAELARTEVGVSVPEPDGVVVPVLLGDPRRAEGAAATMREHGVLVGCFRPPSVPPGGSRLRFTARPGLSDGDFARVALGLRAIR